MAGQSGADRANVVADSVFLLREQNRQFLRGTAPAVVTNPGLPYFWVGLTFLFGFGVFPFFSLDLALVASPLGAVGFGFLLFAFEGNLRDRRFARAGVVLPARVLTVHVSEGDSDNPSRTNIAFDFVTPSGRVLSGRVSVGSTKLIRTPQPGEQVAVIYVNVRLFALL